MMTKRLGMVVCAGVLACTCMIYGLSSRIHSASGEVIAINDGTHVAFADGTGWVLDDTAQYRVGDTVTITYDDMGTDDITDDTVLYVR